MNRSFSSAMWCVKYWPCLSLLCLLAMTYKKDGEYGGGAGKCFLHFAVTFISPLGLWFWKKVGDVVHNFSATFKIYLQLANKTNYVINRLPFPKYWRLSLSTNIFTIVIYKDKKEILPIGSRARLICSSSMPVSSHLYDDTRNYSCHFRVKQHNINLYDNLNVTNLDSDIYINKISF